jgi:hypothetical protein
MDKELLLKLEKTFSYHTPKTITTRPCRIKFLGNFIVTNSKKTIWRNKGHAKLALLNHFKCSFYSSPLPNYTVEEIIKELEKLGHIEYVEADIESFANQAKI